MSKKSKNRSKPQPNQSIKPVTQPAVQGTQVTENDLHTSKSSEEFEKTKTRLIGQVKKEVEEIEKEKEQKNGELEKIKLDIEQENKRLAEIREEKEPLEAEIAALKKERDEIDISKNEAEAEARTIISKAQSDSLKILDEAKKTANSEQHEFFQSLIKKREELNDQERELDTKRNNQEKELYAERIELQKKQKEIDLEKEAFEAHKEFLQKQQERYNMASPEKIEELEIDLTDEKKKYDALKSKYDEQTAKYNQAQITLDNIQADSGGYTVKSLLLEFDTIKRRNEELERIYEKYPDEESINELEKAKVKCETLEVKNYELARERIRYKEEVIAMQTAQRELEIIKQTADATKTLNEHLLKELESYKTALESRTGDTCPELTKVDIEVEEESFTNILNERHNREKLSTLKDIVTHVKNYAGSRREKEKQLYYKDDDIRAFLAGMAVSRLLILQGMSGTGKSSLPRIFSEAVSGFNRLIPVESSWRDRNELLGYYNDFNKKFNAKTFTIELYRSGKKECHIVPTFIVLDEMNLSRIEYYFSDFLAVLQETDPKKWLVELVSNDMRTLPLDIPSNEKDFMQTKHPGIYEIWKKIEQSRMGELQTATTDEEKNELKEYLQKHNLLTGAKDLIDGRKVRVNNNVWFIGTANKDESTFEITDKVYDRAQVISLDQKGIAEKTYDKVKEKRIDVDDLLDLFDKAITDFSNKADSDKADIEEKLKKLDDFLIENFDVSFGNRILRQTIDFAAVFEASGGKREDALDYQISTKILRKVITSDNGDALIQFGDFAKKNKYQKTQYLISKRLKDLG